MNDVSHAIYNQSQYQCWELLDKSIGATSAAWERIDDVSEKASDPMRYNWEPRLTQALLDWIEA